MTHRPDDLLERPGNGSADLLSDALRAVRFTRTVYYTVDVSVPWRPIRVPLGSSFASALTPRTRNVLSYHVVVEGSCWTGLEGGDPIRLEPGDVVVYPRGDAYFLAPERTPGTGTPDASGLVRLLEGVATGTTPSRFTFGPPDTERIRFVCGFLGCDARSFEPLLGALPAVFRVRASEGRLGRLVGLALEDGDGTLDTVVRERLTESLFVETLREYIGTQGGTEAGWLAALSDPLVGRALGLLHERPGERWTLVKLSRAVGASRSALAVRFSDLVGEPPMRYLTRCRLRLAAQSLSEAGITVAEVAHSVGYDSEAAFSRAFKRFSGVPPAAWRSERTGASR